MTEIPYGRGIRQGEDAFVAQNEAYALRGQAIERKVGNVISPLNNIQVGGIPSTSNAFISGRTQFMFLAPLAYDVIVTAARTKVTAPLSAGSRLVSCLYVHDPARGTNVFRKIAPSRADFDTGTVGFLQVTLPSPTLVPARTLLLFAAYVLHSGTGPYITSLLLSTSGLFYSWYTAETNLPDELRSSSLLFYPTATFPLVAYLSADMLEVL